ncbi:BLUF domain-containing protein [Aquabacterium sp. A7-Y]|uniref:BLUF domain-containing protein n=1 Tax=Aquabacterium sp. A7-Y TaxID=1349605 RepID=UPI00223E1785|nr:BLUF domain-containing protein [Aquabacterium sp. A7-Y]MCW7541528.1 BLUF domain-containing protein [Aquabacterium sp. A7-Y]
MLIRLLYCSRAAEALSHESIEAILSRSRHRNPGLGITGILCYGGEVFLQVLEGSREAVNALYKEIVCDERHREVTLLHYEEIAERRFAGWTMGQVNLAKINPSMLLKYSERPVLDPYAVSGRASMALLDELIATASILCRT